MEYIQLNANKILTFETPYGETIEKVANGLILVRWKVDDLNNKLFRFLYYADVDTTTATFKILSLFTPHEISGTRLDNLKSAGLNAHNILQDAIDNDAIDGTIQNL